MNKKMKWIAGILLLSATTLYATDSLVGTEADPLVTKSYVDKKISEISLGNISGNTYEIVVVPQGKTIYGKQGTELIIRAGEASVVASNVGGVQDITDGVDLASNTLAPKFNLLLVPREDGRGLLATKKLTVMVRGGYTIK